MIERICEECGGTRTEPGEVPGLTVFLEVIRVPCGAEFHTSAGAAIAIADFLALGSDLGEAHDDAVRVALADYIILKNRESEEARR